MNAEKNPSSSRSPETPEPLSIRCRECHGTGHDPLSDIANPTTCLSCNGEGWVTPTPDRPADAEKYDPASGNRVLLQDRAEQARREVQELLEDRDLSPSRRYMTLLRVLREILRALPTRTEKLTEADDRKLAEQQMLIDVINSELRTCLLSSHITVADMMVADRYLDTLESVASVFDQYLAEDDAPARICAIEAGYAAHDKLAEIGFGMGGV